MGSRPRTGHRAVAEPRQSHGRNDRRRAGRHRGRGGRLRCPRASTALSAAALTWSRTRGRVSARQQRLLAVLRAHAGPREVVPAPGARGARGRVAEGLRSRPPRSGGRCCPSRPRCSRGPVPAADEQTPRWRACSGLPARWIGISAPRGPGRLGSAGPAGAVEGRDQQQLDGGDDSSPERGPTTCLPLRHGRTVVARSTARRAITLDATVPGAALGDSVSVRRAAGRRRGRAVVARSPQVVGPARPVVEVACPVGGWCG